MAGLSGCAASKPKAPTTTSAADTVRAPSGAAPSPTGPAVTAPGAGPSAPGAPAPGQAGKAGEVGRAGEAGKADPAKAKTDSNLPVVATVKVPSASPAPPRSEPLIMENADRMEGFRSRGEYILSGKVRFTHGPLRLETERAVWLKERSLVYAESGMRITHRGARLTAERGSYDKNQGQATAEGNVRMRDSSGEVEASGNNVTYLRFKHIATLTGNPEVRRFYRKAPDSAKAGDSAEAKAKATDAAAGKSQAAPAPATPLAEGAIIDTLVIRGDVLTYNDSAQVATADGKVTITRKQVQITCKRAEYRDRSDSLYLTGEPTVKLDESQVKGALMRVGMDGEEIKSLMVKGEAHARSVEPATDTSAARQSDVHGDSLFMAFKDKAIDSVQVFRNAKGSYYDTDKPEFVNRMSGEYMVLRFAKKKINSANVLGGAKSTYFHLERRAFKGKNEAEGDTIDFAFKDGKVEEVMVRGRAKGTYFGEPQARKPKADSAARAADTTSPKGAAAPVTPPPAAAAKPADPAQPASMAPARPAPPAGDAGTGEPGREGLPQIPWRKR